MSTGQVLDPPPPSICVNEKGVFSFCKHDTLLQAVYGVITFDMCNSKKRKKAECRLAIMFSVPFDRVSWSNEFGLGVFKPDTSCDDKLLGMMYKPVDNKTSASDTANGSELCFSGNGYIVRGTMSQTCNAIMKVEIYKG